MFGRLLGVVLTIVFVVLALVFALTMRPSEQELVASTGVMAKLQEFRAEPKFLDLPGAPAKVERERMEPLVNDLLDRLLVGLPNNPKKTWVLAQMDPTVASFYLEDTEVRERCVAYIERTLAILGIHSTNGAFYKYFIFI